MITKMSLSLKNLAELDMLSEKYNSSSREWSSTEKSQLKSPKDEFQQQIQNIEATHKNSIICKNIRECISRP